MRSFNLGTDIHEEDIKAFKDGVLRLEAQAGAEGAGAPPHQYRLSARGTRAVNAAGCRPCSHLLLAPPPSSTGVVTRAAEFVPAAGFV